MSARPALRYAKATFNLAKDNQVESKVNDDMLLVANTIAENKDLELLLKSPVIKTGYKIEVLEKIFKDVDSISLGLIKLLAENKRLSILKDVTKQFAVLYDFEKSIDTAIVTTAIPLDDRLKQLILDKVTKLTGNSVAIENIVEPAVLGGYILRIGDVQYDASIASNLKNLIKEFDTSFYEAKI